MTKENLTERQNEIAQLVALGYSNDEIATMLNITDKTVKFHLTTIRKTLRAKNRVEICRILNGLPLPLRAPTENGVQ